jgi:hypothetical protein
MSFELPNTPKLLGCGHSAKEAFDAFCNRVSRFVYEDAEIGLKGHSAFDAFQAVLDHMQRDVVPLSPTRSKSRQKTIGVTSKSSLSTEILDGAGDEVSNFAVRARELFEKGFETLDSRLDDESSQKVFGEFVKSYDALADSESTHWMLRLEPSLYERALVVAHEYKKSLSNLAAMCISFAIQQERAF